MVHIFWSRVFYEMQVLEYFNMYCENDIYSSTHVYILQSRFCKVIPFMFMQRVQMGGSATIQL